ncbi:MAG TPA: 4-hydroxy-3-methylbut-2-enyl diphosphate reductase [Spirochaetaceae bacterium]|nr:4-hydroxy-3-methylbut-2-enyl diphosphate reductase [Spirochaetaceae bacterium]
MQIIRARVLGMCMGVRRAEELARAAAREAARVGQRVYTYGPLIHNPQAVAALEAFGVHVLDTKAIETSTKELPDLKNTVVVIRAHGAPLAALSRLQELGASIVDATCPRVIKSQRLARRYEQQGWQVVLVGDPHHGEIEGILGHTSSAIVVDGPTTALQVAEKLKDVPCALIAQTTIRQEDYDAVIEIFQTHLKTMTVEKTICPATRERQKALVDLCAHVDAVLIVGGKNSENTKRLYTSAIECGMPAWHIETADDLKAEMISFERIGITAGASTPDFIVDEIQKALLTMTER